MRLLLDSNVLVAALVSRGLCADLVSLATALHDMGQVSVHFCPTVEAEVYRILTDKLHATPEYLRLAHRFFATLDRVPDGTWTAPPGFPDPGDVPIVGAALEAGPDTLVTGDKALLTWATTADLSILSPREAFLALRGLS